MHARLIHSDTGRSRALHPQHALEMDDQWGVDRVNVAQASLYLQGATLKFQPKNGGGGGGGGQLCRSLAVELTSGSQWRRGRDGRKGA